MGVFRGKSGLDGKGEEKGCFGAGKSVGLAEKRGYLAEKMDFGVFQAAKSGIFREKGFSVGKLPFELFWVGKISILVRQNSILIGKIAF